MEESKEAAPSDSVAKRPARRRRAGETRARRFGAMAVDRCFWRASARRTLTLAWIAQAVSLTVDFIWSDPELKHRRLREGSGSLTPNARSSSLRRGRRHRRRRRAGETSASSNDLANV